MMSCTAAGHVGEPVRAASEAGAKLQGPQVPVQEGGPQQQERPPPLFPTRCTRRCPFLSITASLFFFDNCKINLLPAARS